MEQVFELSRKRLVIDTVIISIREDGFIKRKHELEADGYKLLWLGNSKMCYVKETESEERK